MFARSYEVPKVSTMKGEKLTEPGDKLVRPVGE